LRLQRQSRGLEILLVDARAFSASSTLPIAALLVSEASRAVFASVVTPPSTCARSGGTDSCASPVTEIVAMGVTCANAGAATNPLANAMAKTARTFILPYFSGT